MPSSDFINKNLEKDADKNDDKPAEMLTHPTHEELIQQLSESEKKAEQHWERVLRLQADMENMARRNERDLTSAHKFALEKFALELLPIIDSLELCIANGANAGETTVEALMEGVRMTLKMFQSAFEKFGMQSVNPISQPFNPEIHQAISTQLDLTVEPNTVVSVLQKGYLLNGRLIRPALVVVAKHQED